MAMLHDKTESVPQLDRSAVQWHARLKMTYNDIY